jgi:hypothetical protein
VVNVSVTLSGGDGFTIADVSSGERLTLPMGKHTLTIGRLGYDYWVGQVDINGYAEQVLNVELHMTKR